MRQNDAVTACAKVRYPSKLAAKIALASIAGRDSASKGNRKRADERRPYWCMECRCWHLTSRGRRQSS